MKIIYLLFFLFVACRPSNVDKEALELLLNKSDYCMVDSLGFEKIEIKYRPSDLLVEQEFSLNKNLSIVDLQSKYGLYYYFNMTIFFNGEVDNMFDLLNSNDKIEDLIYILDENGNKVLLMDYSMPPFIGGKKTASVLVAFKKDQIQSSNFEIIYKSIVNEYNEYKFLFNKEKLNNVPKLNNI